MQDHFQINAAMKANDVVLIVATQGGTRRDFIEAAVAHTRTFNVTRHSPSSAIIGVVPCSSFEA